MKNKDIRTLSSLRQLCMDKYLSNLETACASYIHLTMLDSPFLRNITSNILPSLKNHLENQCPASSGNIREEMLDIVLSGKFPTSNTKSTYQLDKKKVQNNTFSEQEASQLAEMKMNGSRCCNLSCTGVYVMETMACVFVSDQIRELVLDWEKIEKQWAENNEGQGRSSLGNLLKIDMFSILSNYFSSLQMAFKTGRKPLLKKLEISKQIDLDEDFDKTENILEFFVETKNYIDYPERLLSDTTGEPSRFECNSDMTLVLGNIFSFGLDSFEKLTDIELKGFKFGERIQKESFAQWTVYPPKLSTTLFKNIGSSCPNLKSFKMDHMSNIQDVLVPLFFKDPACLNAYVMNNVVEERIDEVLPFRLVDDKLYEFMKEKYKEDIGSYFPNVVKASNLVRFVEEEQAEKQNGFNKLCNSIQIFEFDVYDFPKLYYPFLLTMLPKLKTFNPFLVDSLRLMNSWNLDKPLPNIEEMIFAPRMNMSQRNGHGYNFINSLQMKSDEFKEEIEEFLSKSDDVEIEDSSKIINSDLQILSKYCPNLKSLVLRHNFEEPLAVEAWKPLQDLKNLTSLNIPFQTLEPMSNLFEIVGKKLKKLVMTRQYNHETEAEKVMYVDKLLQICPELQWLEFNHSDNGILLSNSPPENLNISNLKIFKAPQQYFSKDAFLWLWPKMYNIEKLHIDTIHEENSFNYRSPEVLFERGTDNSRQTEFQNLFKRNSLKKLELFSVRMKIKDVESAVFFLESLSELSRPDKVGRLHVSLNLSRFYFQSKSDFVAELRIVRSEQQELFKIAAKKMKNLGTDVEFCWDIGDVNRIVVDEPQHTMIKTAQLLQEYLDLEFYMFG